MSEFDVCTLGAASLNSVTNVATVETVREYGTDGEFEPTGEAALVQALGLTALPLGPSAAGHAEGVLMTPCGPYTSAIIGSNDTRCADVYGELLPGDTCLHSTGEDSANRARVFCKHGNLALLIGNDLTMVFDRENKAVSLAAFGHAVEVSDASGIYLAESGGASFRLGGGEATLSASSLNLAGAVSIGNAAALPPALAVPLASYLAAVEGVLAAIAPLIDVCVPNVTVQPPPATTIVSTFIAASAALKAAIPATFTKVT